MGVQLHHKYVLGEFELDADKYLLKRRNQSVHLAELPFQVLVYLVEYRERYVSRQELLERFRHVLFECNRRGCRRRRGFPDHVAALEGWQYWAGSLAGGR